MSALFSALSDFTADDVYISQNNLGGEGPDTGAEELRFKNVGSYGGSKIDLVVTAIENYTVFNNGQNRINKKFGQINLPSQGSSNSTKSLDKLRSLGGSVRDEFEVATKALVVFGKPFHQ